jgi:hypothetical protein
MNFKEKIDNLLRVSEKKFNSIYDLEVKSGVGTGTLRKAYDENREPSKRTIWKFLEALSINTEWWESGKGDIYLVKSTHGDNESDNTENSHEDTSKVMHGIAETISEYRLVHRAVLNEEYRIVLKTELEEKNALLKEVVESKNALIVQLKSEIAKHLKDIDRLTSGQPVNTNQAK